MNAAFPLAFTSPMDFEFLNTQDLAPVAHAEIEAFLDRQNNSHPYQFPKWMGAGRNDEHKYCAIVREQGEIRWFAHCGMMFPAGKWVRAIRSLTVTRGPAGDDADLTLYGLGKLVEKSRELGFADVRIAPDWVESPEWNVGSGLAQNGWQSLPGSGKSLRLNLGIGTDELLRSFRHDTKLHIRRSVREGIAVRQALDEAGIEVFQRIYYEMAQQKNFLGADRGHLSHVLRWVVSQKDRGALLLAFKDETPLGGVLVVRAGTRSWGVFSATVKDTGLNAGHVLQWSAIQWAKNHGCIDYDLGGYREGLNTGPASFKRGFCRSVVQFSPAYKYPLHRRLCSIVDFVADARTKLRAPS